MKRFSSLIVLALSIGAVSQLQAAPVAISSSGITLADCYKQARQISESVGISAENIRLLQAEYHDKLGDILPHADWIRQQFYQQNVNTNLPGTNSATGSSLLATQPLSYFQLTQPLFSGGRDWNALDIAKSQQQQSRFDLQQAEQNLLSDVATAFYTALTAQAQEATLEDTQKVTQDRLKELNHWVNVGRSLSSDLLSAQTELATINAQIEEAKRAQMVARETLRFLTEIPSDIPLVDDRPDPQPLSLEEALEHSNQRPDLMSEEEALRQSQLNVRFAKGGYWPTLGFVGRYYTERVGFQSDIRWDAAFNLDVPIFAGGSTHAQVQAARSQNIIAELTVHQLKRSVEQQVRTSQQNLTSLIAVAGAYAKAADMGQKNYDAQAKEYRNGRTSNIEVLQVLNNLQTAKSQAVLAKYSAKLSEIQFRVSIGEGL